MENEPAPCPGCGTGVVETDKFCPTCGTPLEWEGVDQSESSWKAAPQSHAQDGGGSSWGAWIVGILAVIGGLWVVSAFIDDDTGGAESIAPSPASQARYYVYVDSIPDYLTADQARNDEAAVNSAIQAWASAGTPVSRVDSKSDANLYIQFIKEWGGETLGQQYGQAGGLLQIGLGNGDCLGEWVPFAAQSVKWIAAHELGHAFGHDHSSDPSSLMNPTFNPTYADYCKMWDDATSWSAGATKSFPFSIAVDSSIKYHVQDRDNGALDVCIMPQADWNAYTGSNMQGYACHNNVNWATDEAKLAAGSYVLAMRCENWFDNCIVDYNLWRWP